MLKNIIILIGPPASGKGTQGEIIASHLDYLYFGMGEKLKDIMECDPEMAKEIKKIEMLGKLVPDDLINKQIKKFIDQNDKHIVFDGYPRTLSQAEFFDKIIPSRDLKVIYFQVSDETVIKRTEGRRICSNCDKIFLPPESLIQKNCTECGEPLIQRPDDKKEIVEKRLVEYHKSTQPLIDYYLKKGNLIKINAEQAVEKVTKEILSSIK